MPRCDALRIWRLGTLHRRRQQPNRASRTTSFTAPRTAASISTMGAKTLSATTSSLLGKRRSSGARARKPTGASRSSTTSCIGRKASFSTARGTTTSSTSITTFTGRRAGSRFNSAKNRWRNGRQRGQDVHSLVADPLFRRSRHGDFTLKPGSPAAKIGFQPIDMSQMGRTARRSLPQTQDP